jgi:hypothetical protein
MSNDLSPEVLCINCEYPIFADQEQHAVAAGPNEGCPRHAHTTACYVAGRRINESQARRIAELERENSGLRSQNVALKNHVDLFFKTQKTADEFAKLSAETPSVRVNADLLWIKLMDWCKKRNFRPTDFGDLFAIVGEVRTPVPPHYEACATCGDMVCVYRAKQPVPPTSVTAPIVKIKVTDGDIPRATFYAPGLPDGEHDLYCEPPTVKDSLTVQRLLGAANIRVQHYERALRELRNSAYTKGGTSLAALIDATLQTDTPVVEPPRDFGAGYVCPMCGPDPQGADAHAQRFHTVEGLFGEPGEGQ